MSTFYGQKPTPTKDREFGSVNRGRKKCAGQSGGRSGCAPGPPAIPAGVYRAAVQLQPFRDGGAENHLILDHQ